MVNCIIKCIGQRRRKDVKKCSFLCEAGQHCIATGSTWTLLYPLISHCCVCRKRTMSAFRQSLQCVASQQPALQKRPAFSFLAVSTPATQDWFPTAGGSLTDSAGGARISAVFSADWRLGAESLCFDVSSATHL